MRLGVSGHCPAVVSDDNVPVVSRSYESSSAAIVKHDLRPKLARRRGLDDCAAKILQRLSDVHVEIGGYLLERCS